MADAATKTNETQGNDEVAKALQAKMDRMEKVIALSPEHRTHFDTLKGEDADGWLAKSEVERDDTIRKAAEADQVVYKAADGTEYRKSDDQRLVDLAKARDEDAKVIAEMRKERAEADVAEIAKSLDSLPGDLDTRKHLVKAILGIDDKDAREKAMTALKAQNADLAKSMQELGVSGEPVEKADDPDAKITELAKKYAKDNEVSIEKARVEVLHTAEGSELLKASLEATHRRD